MSELQLYPILRAEKEEEEVVAIQQSSSTR